MQYDTDRLASQWKDFEKTEAYKALIEYIEFQNNCAIDLAKGSFNEDEQVDLTKTYPYLQRSVGYDIIREYIDGYIGYKSLDNK